VHVSELGADYFHFDEKQHAMVGERTNRRFRLSDRVKVQLMRVDMEQNKIYFRLIDDKPNTSGAAAKSGKPTKKGYKHG
jgi:ribonuclease R